MPMDATAVAATTAVRVRRELVSQGLDAQGDSQSMAVTDDRGHDSWWYSHHHQGVTPVVSSPCPGRLRARLGMTVGVRARRTMRRDVHTSGRVGRHARNRYERPSPRHSVQRSSLTRICTAACHPGPAVGLRLADGRQVFVKAVSAEVRAHNHKMIPAGSGEFWTLCRSRCRRLDASPPSKMGRGSPWPPPGPPAQLETSWTNASIAACCERRAGRRTSTEHRAPCRPSPSASSTSTAGHAYLRSVRATTGRRLTRGLAADVVAGWEHWTAGDALVHRDLRLDNTTVDGRERLGGAARLGRTGRGRCPVDRPRPDGGGRGPPPDTSSVSKRRRNARTNCCGRLPPEASRFVVGVSRDVVHPRRDGPGHLQSEHLPLGGRREISRVASFGGPPDCRLPLGPVRRPGGCDLAGRWAGGTQITDYWSCQWEGGISGTT